MQTVSRISSPNLACSFTWLHCRRSCCTPCPLPSVVYQGRFTAADMGGPAAGNSLEQLYQLFEVGMAAWQPCMASVLVGVSAGPNQLSTGDWSSCSPTEPM